MLKHHKPKHIFLLLLLLLLCCVQKVTVKVQNYITQIMFVQTISCE